VALVTWSDALALDARFPKLQFSVPLEIEQVPGPPYAGLMLQLTPVPDGNGSLSVAEVAVAFPVLLTASVYPIDEPPATVAASAVFVKLNAGHCTVTVDDACTELLLLALAVAVFAYGPQLAAPVALLTCTDALALDARFPKLQLSVPLEMEQVPGPPYAGLMLQLTPVPVGSGSLSVAEVAVPAPVLLTASVYPIDDPAATVAASAVFVKFSPGHCTVVVAVDWTELAFPALAVAVFE
jgi:hypothetical protein